MPPVKAKEYFKVLGSSLIIANLGLIIETRPSLANNSQLKFCDNSNYQSSNINYNAQCAYLYGYSALMMDYTKRIMTNVPAPTSDASTIAAPINQFAHTPSFPSPTSKDVVRPNNDTLYSLAWLDTSVDPMILSLPAMPEVNGKPRYYIMPLLDSWTNVFESIGNRTNYIQGGDFAIVGPNWNPQTQPLPTGVKAIKAPTNTSWILGRTQTNGEVDYQQVQQLQAQYKLTPLSAWGTAYTPPINTNIDPNLDMTTPPPKQVNQLSGENFFSALTRVMKSNPPLADDGVMLQRLKTVGIIPGEDLNFDNLSIVQQTALNQAPQLTLPEIAQFTSGKQINGWSISNDLGSYDTDYLLRANTALFGLGANLPEDALYPSVSEDIEGDQLNGSQKNYRLHFDSLPPVNSNAFWSLTLYDNQGFFVNNEINRYSLGSRNFSEGLRLNPDGSLDIYIQSQAPSGWESNWLPAPNGEFNLTMRMYWPDQSAIDFDWVPPGITATPVPEKNTTTGLLCFLGAMIIPSLWKKKY